MPHKAGMGAIFGIVSENGVAKSGSPVYLMDMRRDLGVGQAKILLKKTTKPDGGFVFNGLDPNYADYSIMASDEDGLIPKNALMQDRVQPVPTTAGLGALADWYTRIFKDGATAGFVGIHYTGQPVKPLGLVGSMIYVGEPAQTGVSMDIPEIPSLAPLILNKEGSLATYGRSNDALFSSFTVELLLDLDSFRADSGELMVIFGGYNNTSLKMGTENPFQEICNLVYNKNSKQIYIQEMKFVNVYKYVKIGIPVSLSDYSGTVHLVVTWQNKSALKFYVNGVLINTQPLQTDLTRTGKGVNFMHIGGTNADISVINKGAVCNIGLAVGYPLVLSASQIEEHYKSLYNNNLPPLAAGYAKEMLTSLPSWYYRFNDIDITKGVSGELEARSGLDNLPPARSLLRTSDPYDVEMLVDSPILGNNTFEAPTGKSFIGSDAGLLGFTFNNQFSFSFWAKFTAALPSVAEQIIYFEDFAEGVNPFFRVTRKTDGKISVLVKGGLGNEVFNFDYSPPVNSWVNLWVVLDNRGLEPAIKLYAGTEVVEIALVELLPTANATLYTSSNHVGANYPGNTTLSVEVAKGLTGSVCELAMFHNAISESRIKEIWASKDTP